MEELASLPIELLVAAGIGVVVAAGAGVALLRRRPAALDGEEDATGARVAVAGEAGTKAPKPGPKAPKAGPKSAGAPATGLAQRFFAGLARSREAFSRSLGGAWSGDSALEERLEALEEALIAADVGVRTAGEICEALRERVDSDADGETLKAHLAEVLRESIGDAVPIAAHEGDGPLVILVVGVNGSGKTTTIGKLATRYVRDGKKVLLAAGDTFRAGAIEQLQVWGERAGVPVVAHQEGADPAAVVFDGVKAGNARGMDVVICDTAGRLQAQKTLMDELGKVLRVMKKAQPDAPHEVLLVLDATIGQNALSQAQVFRDVVGVTGVALTKLDGTARGGVVVAVGRELGIPVKLVGLGEGADDLRDFDPDAFVAALLGPSAA